MEDQKIVRKTEEIFSQEAPRGDCWKPNDPSEVRDRACKSAEKFCEMFQKKK